MKRVTDAFRPMDPDIRGQMSIGAHHPCLETSANGIVKMHYLRKAVDASIGPPRASCSDRLTRNLAQRCFQCLLHRGDSQMGLSLPTVVVPAMVFNSRRNTATRGKGCIREPQ